MNPNAAESLLFVAGSCHAAQIPALLLAPRLVAWDSGQPILLRIERVLNWTVPITAITLAALLIVHGGEVFTARLGQGLCSLLAGQWLLFAYARLERGLLGAAGRGFARRRREISYTLLGLGLVVVLNAREVATTRLGASLCLGLGVLYLVRLALQALWYRGVWPEGTAGAVAHWTLVALFSVQSALYVTVAARFFGDVLTTGGP